MKVFPRIVLTVLALATAGTSLAQDDDTADEKEMLKIAALQALISAPPERALPIVKKVLAGNHSDDVKQRALFVLSQVENAEARELLLQTARSSTGDLQLEAIRMIGINGDPAILSALGDIYRAGNLDTRESVLEAWMIAGDKDSVFQVASNAADDEEFEIAVNMLSVMGAVEELRSLRGRDGTSESLIHALAIAGDYEGLRALAMDGSKPEQQMQAMQGLGIVGGAEVGNTLVEIYQSSNNTDVREAAMHGLMVAGEDDSLMALYRASSDNGEKVELLQLLTIMNSDAALDLIDEAFAGDL